MRGLLEMCNRAIHTNAIRLSELPNPNRDELVMITADDIKSKEFNFYLKKRFYKKQ
ncbi:hypothetical protein KHA80_14245 [Anaerobacillus sp. HL2]|nr:hypothetical protein KHA80_14245 [Anaerobacillus sp. HL2]